MQTARVTKIAAGYTQEAHDAFDEALVDGVVTYAEIIDIRERLDAATTATSMADVAALIGSGSIRGTIGSRYSRDLVKEYGVLAEQMEDYPPLDAA